MAVIIDKILEVESCSIDIDLNVYEVQIRIKGVPIISSLYLKDKLNPNSKYRIMIEDAISK